MYLKKKNWVKYAILRMRMSLCLCLCASENQAYSLQALCEFSLNLRLLANMILVSSLKGNGGSGTFVKLYSSFGYSAK